MYKVEARPYRLEGRIQHYEWGTKNEEAFIPNFLGIPIKQGLPYAEYWIGVHPKASSDILVNGEKISLIDFLESNPVEILGKRIAEKFNSTLPFLLKVLSINKALSIQAHPDKTLAEILHKRDPQNYPDSNHKPEIAIAIDKLTALVGLKTYSEIRILLNDYSEIKSLIHSDLINELNSEGEDRSDLIKKIYSEIMNSSQNKIDDCIENIINKLNKKKTLSQSEKQFLIQRNNYGNDVGLISILLFNLINLKSFEAIFTPAGIPHAYISGNIIECMANSDNVVRAGLTPKFIDIKTLVDMVELNFQNTIVSTVKSDEGLRYITAAKEFEIKKYNKNLELEVINNSEVRILLILDGKIEILVGNITYSFNKGESVLIPAILVNFTIKTFLICNVYEVRVPMN